MGRTKTGFFYLPLRIVKIYVDLILIGGGSAGRRAIPLISIYFSGGQINPQPFENFGESSTRLPTGETGGVGLQHRAGRRPAAANFNLAVKIQDGGRGREIIRT